MTIYLLCCIIHILTTREITLGSWNKTCGLSNLHITAGTPVYVFVLEVDMNNVLDNCYTTSLFRPTLMPFNSIYNDYGGGENSSGPGLELVMTAIKKYLVEGRFRSIEVKKDTFNVDVFFEAAHSKGLAIQRPFSGSETKLTFVMFRKDIVDTILETQVNEKYVGANKGKHGYDNAYIQFDYKDVINSIPAFIEKVTTTVKQTPIESTLAPYIEIHIRNCLEDLYRGEFSYDNLACGYLKSDKYMFSRLVEMNKLIIQYVQEDRLDELKPLLEEHIKACYIDEFMNSARKTWAPGGHEGSQSTSTDAITLLCNTITNVLDLES